MAVQWQPHSWRGVRWFDAASADKRFFDGDDVRRGFEYCVGVERNAVDALAHQKLGKFRVVAWRLPADADFAF